ncbi:F-box protein [Aspergillus affinis]|uniref:F-box protein n=1 Tax=Aspergillus affinis TaxID=1070780 RepID=UPI0022FE1A7E|nr:uncharacterized protein KD926_009665 [Aspergillus affinis]KAI9045251.1 hypothetical protein KD926_009665 [Aspergillus affinis]
MSNLEYPYYYYYYYYSATKADTPFFALLLFTRSFQFIPFDARHLNLMSPNVYCPFCGVILLPDPYSDDPASPRTRVRPWYAEIRGIYSNANDVSDIALTGLGIVVSRNYLNAPLDSDSSYVGVGTEALEEWRLFQSSEIRWCFGFHESCWRLLLLRLGHGQNVHFPDQMAVAESVFYQLYCTPCLEASRFQFGHDYEGAAQTQKTLGRPTAIDPSSHLYADPCAIPPTEILDDSLWRKRNVACSSNAIAANIDCLGGGATCVSEFFKLSPELRFEVLSYLSFHELLSMRLVCRDLALFATVDKLPQSYWRTRFLLGQEADFLFPNLSDTRDWSRLFFGTRASLRARCLPLVNRKRVRQLLEPIAALVDLAAVFRNGPYGSTFEPAKTQGNYYQLADTGKPPRPMEKVCSFSGQLAAIDADSPLHDGCRVLYDRAQLFMSPLARGHRQRIGISTIQIGTRGFISGISLFPPGDNIAVDHQAGYHNHASEKWVEIPSSSYVNALCVSFCSEGLTGIKFMFTNSDPSGWIGNNSGPGIAYGTLTIPEGNNQYCLLASLDRFKIVSIGLGELIDHPGDSLTPSSQGKTNLSPAQSHLWIPHVPAYEDLIISDLLPSRPSRTFEPLTNIDFGGSRGLLLGSLTRLTFYMASRPHPLIGIEIFYSNGNSTLFGSNGSCGVSLFVDGPGGERINRIGILEDKFVLDPATGLAGLQISTNYGRVVIFAPLGSKFNAATGLMLTSPPGNTITGFVASESENQPNFIRVAVQSQKCAEQPVVPDTMDWECHQIPEDQLRYDEIFSHYIDSSNPGNYQTYASLKNVRKIQASVGIQGRSRSTNRISGLKLEYYDHPSPGIIGQWMDGLSGSFELSQDERVQSLTVWATPMGFSRECRRMEVGQVAAIQFETTCSRSVIFRSPDFHPLPPRKLQHQYQIDSDEEMAAISWIFNVHSDGVRAVLSTEGSRSDQLILVPHHPPPFDQVQKLYFETHDEAGGRDTVAEVMAQFRDRAIIGLVFVYASGRKANIGEFNTGTCQTVHFVRNARIVGLSSIVTEPELREIGFEVELNEQSGYEHLTLAMNSPSDVADPVGYDWRDVWCKDGMSAESYQCSARDRVHKPPSESRIQVPTLQCAWDPGELVRRGCLGGNDYDDDAAASAGDDDDSELADMKWTSQLNYGIPMSQL